MSFASAFPLLATFVDRLELNAFGGGVLIALPSLTLTLVTVPGAGLVNRLGSRSVIAAGVALSALTTASFPLITNVPLVLVNRALFGLAMGITWVAGSEWISQLEREQMTRTGVSGLVVALGIGLGAGPPLAGVLSDLGGLAFPFVLLGTAQATCAGVLLLAETNAPRPAARADTAGTGIRAAARDPRIVLAAAGLFMSGLLGTGSNVLAGLDLRRTGLSEAATGWVLATGVLVYLVAAILASNFGPRVVATALLGATVCAQALAFTPAAIEPSVVGIAVTLVLAGSIRGYVATVALPYSEWAGNVARIPSSIVFGFILAVWAFSAVVGPLTAGALSQAYGSGAWLYMELSSLGALLLVATWARRLPR